MSSFYSEGKEMDSKREGINFWFVTVKMIVNKAKTGPIGNHRSRLSLKKNH